MTMKTCYTVINAQVVSEDRNGVARDYLTDGLGNTLALLDNTQTKTDTFDYFPSGTVAVRTGATATPFQWVGGQGYFKDSGTRTYVRARNFHNNLGRWGSQDPIGFNGEDFNLYRYVNNRFVTAKDPSGLACKAKNISVSLEGPTCKDYGSLGTCYFDLSAHFTLRFTVPKGGDANDCWIHQYQRELYENDPFYYPDDTDETGVHHWPWVTSQAIGKRSWEYPKTFVAEDRPGVHVGRTINPTCNANWDYDFVTCVCGTEGPIQCYRWYVLFNVERGNMTLCQAGKPKAIEQKSSWAQFCGNSPEDTDIISF